MGNMGPTEQYAGPMQKCEMQCLQLAMPPPTLERKAQALVTWAYPVFDVVGRMVHPTEKICSRVDEMARKAISAKSYGFTAAHLQQRKAKGGIGFALTSLFLLHLHSKRYVQWMQDLGSLSVAHTKTFGTCRWPYLDNKVAK